jgi:ABC-type transporter Mla maintaining outer membrane lipid asymmetry ATPase subunit MlaF
VADRIALFKDGRVHFSGDREELFALEDPYVQRFLA